MRKLCVLLSLILAVAVVTWSQNPPPQPPQQPAQSQAQEKAKAQNIEVEIVSVDATAKTITFKHEGQDMTHKVDDRLASKLAELKAGDKVRITLQEKEGAQIVTNIRKAAPPKQQ